MRIAFVVCPSYHGATLLALLLNNHSQISALGDMLPLRSVDQICACGRRISECDFWQEITARVNAERFTNLRTMLPVTPWPLSRRRTEGGIVHLSKDPRVNRAAGRVAAIVTDVLAPVAWRLRGRPVADFVDAYRTFYQAVLDLHGTSMFIDGNKSWRKVALLAPKLGAVADMKIVHLVRDPRGFAVSSRSHSNTDPREATLLWAELHRRMESLASIAPYRLLRYEDICRRPEAELRALLDFLGVEAEDVIAAPKYERKHHIIGNRMLRTFDGNVVLDERWRRELTPDEQRRVLRYAGELAARLGYTSDDQEQTVA
jgi:hypothetical protein